MLRIDGSRGEGGGQILRSSLSLSMLSGRSFHIRNVRATRSNPGLNRQHLTALRAAGEVCGARVDGDRLDSREIVFRPGTVSPGRYHFSTGGAGSTTLVLQTVLPPLLTASGPSEIVVEGGTHNPFAPPFEFLERVFLPAVRRTGPAVTVELERYGFYPRGGGRIRARIEPAADLQRLELLHRGPVEGRRARAVVSDLPRHIAERELSIAHAMLELRPDELEVVDVEDPAGPGNVIMVEIRTAAVTELFTAFGRRGVPAEEVAAEACRQVLGYLDAGAPVGPHLADQLLLPLAAGPGGAYVTHGVTSHARTQTWVLERFLDVGIVLEEVSGANVMVRVEP